jgi:hypothetical protein
MAALERLSVFLAASAASNSARELGSEVMNSAVVLKGLEELGLGHREAAFILKAGQALDLRLGDLGDFAVVGQT